MLTGVCTSDTSEQTLQHCSLVSLVSWVQMYLNSRYAGRLSGQRFVVRMDEWTRRLRSAPCHLVRALGPLDLFTTQESAILVELGVPDQPFSQRQAQEQQTRWRLMLHACLTRCIRPAPSPAHGMGRASCRRCAPGCIALSFRGS